MPKVRHPVGCTVAGMAAILAIMVVGDVARSFYGTYKYQKRINRVSPGEVQLEGVQLTFTRGRYHLSGQIHNGSSTYALREVTIAMVIEDCVNGECHEQAQGTAHVGCHVPPNQSAMFDFENVILSAALTPRGERRVNSRVAYTVADE
jgi:hypothetical protein